MLSRGVAGELADLTALARCPICDGPVVDGPRPRGAKAYCSHRCQKVANGRREAAASTYAH